MSPPQQPTRTGCNLAEEDPNAPFVPLEDTMDGDGKEWWENVLRRLPKHLDAKKVVSSSIFTILFLLVWDSMFSAPQDRLIKPDFSKEFLDWVQVNPAQGLFWILIFMSVAVVFMIPIGTPLTLGCGYIYKGAYGWKLGVFLATCVSMLGSALGAVICFLLGRHEVGQGKC